jgi:hypothetical protein
MDAMDALDASAERVAELVELIYGQYAPRAHSGALYATGWVAAPTRPLPEGATPLERLIHLMGR